MAKRPKISFNGKTMTVSEWSKSIGMSCSALAYRLDNGWSVRDALTTPVQPQRSLKPHRKGEIKAKVAPSEPIALLLRANMAAQREMTRMLRQFNRDLMLMMSRSGDAARLHALVRNSLGEPDPSIFKGPGVVSNFAEKPSDQSLPSTQETPKLEKFT